MPKFKEATKQQKIFFLYFIIVSVIILIVFAYIITSSFWDYWSQSRSMENYYKNRLLMLNQYVPQINRFDPIKGQTDAAATIFIYADFHCPACKNLQANLASLEKLYGTKIRFIFKGLPVTSHPENRPALNAAYCAAEQESFWQYKDLLYQNNSILTNQLYKQFAGDLNLNLESFNKCLEDNKYAPVIEANIAEALNLQINSIPTVYVNEQKLEGLLNYNMLKNAVEKNIR